MKHLFPISILSLFLIPSLFPDQLTLEWERGTGGPDPDGYAIFHKDFQHPYDFSDELWEGTGTQAIVTIPGDRQTAFTCRAYINGVIDLDGHNERVWSEDSNEIVYTPVIAPPERPRSLVVKILVAILNLFKGIFA